MPQLDDILLAAAPFHLDLEAIRWVQSTRDRLSIDDKLRQLINEASQTDDRAAARALAAQRLGGITRFASTDPEAAWEATRILVEEAEIPPLISGDLEGGGIGMPCATATPNQLGLAATDSADTVSQVGMLVAKEGRALGYHWAFGPVLDINARYRSAIVATRSFGSEPERVLRLAQAHVKATQAAGLAATLKHWPGEGFDERDQHLVTTLNPLEMDQWEATFGKLYRTLIGEGALSVMSAHIALPAWARACGESGLELYRPATVSRHLNLGLLRGQLGFNGLIVSDATTMAGLGSWASRDEFLPEVIENGCDMILFSMQLDEDMRRLHQALGDGRLSMARVDAALTRVLALKAALGLHRLQRGQRQPAAAEMRATLRNPGHRVVASQAAAHGVTLVKDVQALLPLTPERHRRVVVITERERVGFVNNADPAPLALPRLLRERGFDVREYDPANAPRREDTDVVLLLLAQESLYTQGNIFLDWRRVFGSPEAAMRRVWHDVPSALISFGHPYYAFDAPRMPCIINAYSAIEAAQQAVLARLLGEAAFTGNSPVDALCGLPDAAF